MRRIATEEAFSIPEIARALQQVARGPTSSLDRALISGIYDAHPGDKGYAALHLLAKLLREKTSVLFAL